VEVKWFLIFSQLSAKYVSVQNVKKKRKKKVKIKYNAMGKNFSLLFSLSALHLLSSSIICWGYKALEFENKQKNSPNAGPHDCKVVVEVYLSV